MSLTAGGSNYTIVQAQGCLSRNAYSTNAAWTTEHKLVRRDRNTRSAWRFMLSLGQILIAKQIPTFFWVFWGGGRVGSKRRSFHKNKGGRCGQPPTIFVLQHSSASAKVRRGKADSATCCRLFFRRVEATQKQYHSTRLFLWPKLDALPRTSMYLPKTADRRHECFPRTGAVGTHKTQTYAPESLSSRGKNIG